MYLINSRHQWNLLELLFFSLLFVACSLRTGYCGMLETGSYDPCDTNYLCFKLTRHNQTERTYNFNHSGCIINNNQQSKLLSCSLDNNHTLTCKDENLALCSLKEISYCMLDIDVHGYDENGQGKTTHLKRWLAPDVKKSALRVRKVTADRISDSWIEISWLRPECKFLEYSYQWRYSAKSDVPVEGKETLSDSAVGDDKRNGVINSLKPFTVYNICVSSHVKFWPRHEPPVCVTIQTAEAKPASAPKNIQTQTISTKMKNWQCKITWESVKEEDFNGIVKNVTLEIYNKDNHDVFDRAISVPINQSQYVIRDLAENSDYWVRLKLCNGAGCTSTKKQFISMRNGQNNRSSSKALTKMLWFIIIGIVVSLIALLPPGIFVRQIYFKRPARRTISTDHLVVVPRPEDIFPVQFDESMEHIYEEVGDSIRDANQTDRFERDSEIQGEPALPIPYIYIAAYGSDNLYADSESLDPDIEAYTFETNPLMPCSYSTM